MFLHMRKESWERAKKLLLGAVDVVLQLKEKKTDDLTFKSSQNQSHEGCSKHLSVSTQASSAASSSFVNKPST